ncbi:MAG: DMT family transporter [Paracoccaceae bacterium]
MASAPPSASLRAALMMVVCCAFVALSTFLAKALGGGVSGEPMHAFQIVLGRYFFALVPFAALMLWRRTGLRGAPWRLYVGRSAVGWVGIASLFTAVSMIPLADATAISFLNPVFAMILAIFFLGERVGPVRWLAALIALSGGAVLIRPGFGAIEPGALIALFGACFMAIEVMFAKLLARRDDLIRLLFGTNLLATIIAAITASFVWRAPTWEEVALLALVGLTMMTAQTLFMAALKITDASFATPFFYSTLIFAALYDAIWFKVIPAPISFLGAGLIVAGAALLALRDAKAGKSRPPAPMPPVEGG